MTHAMATVDDRGAAISGSTAIALASFERALASFQRWGADAAGEAERAASEAPGFVMAHALRAWISVCSRDPSALALARPIVEKASRLRANPRERVHLAAIAAAIDDDHERMFALLDGLLADDPTDVLALQAAHAFDYLVGSTSRLRSRVAAVLGAWSEALPGYHAVLAMHAFGLEECGEVDEAEQTALRALALEPRDARAHHVLAHVYEATGRPGEGVRWLGEHLPAWAIRTTVATHCWWHLALFHLDLGHDAHALSLFDRRVRAGRSTSLADLIDASALLWRLKLHGAALGGRAEELAAAFAAHVDDRFCTFSDLHAMLAFACAGDARRMARLIGSLTTAASTDTRHGATTRAVGLPACRALLAFMHGDFGDAIEKLAPLVHDPRTLGGSHAQRDVLRLTLRAAVDGLRLPRPARRTA
jgi:hypothetical protein